jgi:hypothetical protein
MLLILGKDAYKTELAATFESLTLDESPTVRKTIACGFHEVSMHAYARRYMPHPLSKLLVCFVQCCSTLFIYDPVQR